MEVTIPATIHPPVYCQKLRRLQVGHRTKICAVKELNLSSDHPAYFSTRVLQTPTENTTRIKNAVLRTRTVAFATKYDLDTPVLPLHYNNILCVITITFL